MPHEIEIRLQGDRLRTTVESRPVLDVRDVMTITADRTIVSVGDMPDPAEEAAQAHPGATVSAPFRADSFDADAAGAFLRWAVHKSLQEVGVGGVRYAIRTPPVRLWIHDWDRRDPDQRRALARAAVSHLGPGLQINGKPVARRSRLDAMLGRRPRILV